MNNTTACIYHLANRASGACAGMAAIHPKEAARIPVGKAPVQVGFVPEGGRAYVSLRDENSVAVIDTAQRNRIASIAVGRNPIQVFVTPDGRYVYVANQGSEANPDSTVSVIDTATQKVIGNIKVDKCPNGITFSAISF